MRRALALLSVVAFVVTTGCEVLSSGKEENLEFKLDTDDRLFPASFSTPLGTGLEIDVLAFIAGSNGQDVASLNLAQSRAQGIARVSSFSGHRIVIRGFAPGTAEIEVVAAAGNDAFDIHVADIAKVDLTYPGALLVPETPPVRVAVGGTARFGVTLKDSGGRTLVGYGAFPVTIAPATAGAVQASDDVAHLNVQFSELGTATLTPQGGTALDVTVVAQSEVTSLALEPTATTQQVGKDNLAVLRGMTDASERVVGLSGLATLTSATAGVCSVEESPNLGDAVWAVHALAAGDCKLEADFGSLIAAATITITQ